MTEKLTLARVYAKAAFSYALEQQCIEEWSVLFNNTAQVAKDERVVKIIKNPAYTSGRLADFFIGIVGLTTSKNFCNLISVLAQNNRLYLLPEIAQVFNNLKLEYNNVVDIGLVSAFDLNDEQKRILQAALEKKLSSKITMDFKTDSSLIAGLIINIGDDVIDASAKGQLEKLAKQLAA